MIIRDATLADVSQLVELGLRFRAKTSYAGIVAENPAQMAQTATMLIEQPQSTVMVAESRTGALVAMIGLTCYVHHISGAWTAGEVFWWSESPGAGILLLRQAVSWAQSQRAVTLQMVQPVEEVRLGDLYTRFGFRCIEAAWQLELTARDAVA